MTSRISRAHQLHVLTIPDSAGGNKCGSPATGGRGFALKRAVKTPLVTDWEGLRVLSPTHFPFPSLPFMTDRGLLAREATPYKRFSPRPSP